MILLLLSLFTLVNGVLNRAQWKYIERCLQHPQITPELRRQIDNTIFFHYLPLAYGECASFIKFHRFKSKLVRKDDLAHYSIIGLYHATRKYDGYHGFTKFARLYIKGSLYKGLTKHYPISKENANERRKKQNTSYDGYDSIDWTMNAYLGKANYNINSQIDSLNMEDYKMLWKKINEQSEFIKMLMHEKFDTEFNVVQSNREIGNKLGYSEEWMRRNIYNTIINLTSTSIYDRTEQKDV